ncbi:MAG TPA: PilT/PilU family type 4a pilus ATPase [Phycisphaerae bacterium]|nr:PilT/PilU family type 4a pilus ATPase [Phycisphaerae bacterium]
MPVGGENASSVEDLLRAASACGASDLVLVEGAAPTVFVGGGWRPLEGRGAAFNAWGEVLLGMLSPTQRTMFDDQKDIDFALDVPVAGRFRVNLHAQRGTLAAAFRAIPAQVPGFESLHLPPVVLSFADFSSGLVLVAGGTGQGKSTTVAAMIEHINQTRHMHIITIEDPIEFNFQHGKSIVEQRQIGEDSPSFASALRHVLRQRPDVIVIGEMRDLETISTALSAAETGHLVLATLHTANATQTLSRIIDVFPPEQQGHVRTQLAASLRGVVCQSLCRDALGEGLVPATEVLVSTTAVRRALRENEAHLIYAMIETGRRQGMHTLEQSLAALVRDGRVDSETALAAAPEAGRLATLIGAAVGDQ